MIRSKRPASANRFQEVQSKLNSETAAMQGKKRDKFKEGDQRKDAMTMGGNLLGIAHRAIPTWRKGI